MKRDIVLFVTSVLVLIGLAFLSYDTVKRVQTLFNNMVDTKTELIDMVHSLNSHIDKMNRLDKLIMDLESVPLKDREEVLAVCYSESRLDYDAIHKATTDVTTRGICRSEDGMDIYDRGVK